MDQNADDRAWHVWMVMENLDRLKGQHHFTWDEIDEGVASLKAFRESNKSAPIVMPRFDRSFVRSGTPVSSLDSIDALSCVLDKGD